MSDGSDSEYDGPRSPALSARGERASGRRVSAELARAPTGPQMSQPGALVADAHTGRHRALLPRAPQPQSPSVDRTQSSPSASEACRYNLQRPTLDSPYRRSNTIANSPGPSGFSGSFTRPSGLQDPQSRLLRHTLPQSSSSGTAQGFPSWSPPYDMQAQDVPFSAPTICECGSACVCPGCMDARGQDSIVTPLNPHSCLNCLGCPLHSFDLAQPSRFDYSALQPGTSDWSSQSSAAVNVSASNPFPPFLPVSIQDLRRHAPLTPSQPTLFPPQYSQNAFQTDTIWNASAAQYEPRGATSACCGGQCKCATGSCVCDADCDGFCHLYQTQARE